METIAINFRCPTDLVEAVDGAAKADHRDRTSMLLKIISDHFGRRPVKNGAKPTPKPVAKKTAPKKKAGAK